MIKQDAFVPRVTQLDSRSLDGEIASILFEKLTDAILLIGPKYLVKFEPELQTFINVILYHVTLREKKQTVGQDMLEIKYDSSINSKRLSIYTFILITSEWLKKRESTLLALIRKNEMKNKFALLWKYCETTFQVLDLINLINFIYAGHYPSILERILQLKIVSSRPFYPRKICYNYFSRELLWNGFTDLLAFLLPLVTIEQFHNFIRIMLPKRSEGSNANESYSDKVAMTPNNLVCVFCNNYSVLPHTFGCKHVSCYYCIYSLLSFNALLKCPICSTDVTTSSVVIPLPKLGTIGL